MLRRELASIDKEIKFWVATGLSRLNRAWWLSRLLGGGFWVDGGVWKAMVWLLEGSRC